jgi:hypothetical protein
MAICWGNRGDVLDVSASQLFLSRGVRAPELCRVDRKANGGPRRYVQALKRPFHTWGTDSSSRPSRFV